MQDAYMIELTMTSSASVNRSPFFFGNWGWEENLGTYLVIQATPGMECRDLQRHCREESSFLSHSPWCFPVGRMLACTSTLGNVPRNPPLPNSNWLKVIASPPACRWGSRTSCSWPVGTRSGRSQGHNGWTEMRIPRSRYLRLLQHLKASSAPE